MKKKILGLVLLVLLCFPMSGSAATQFSDTDMWAKNYISAITDKGLFYGTSSNTFAPNENMTRGQFITVVARYAKADLSGYVIYPFDDVYKQQYYSKPILWGVEQGIIKGVDRNHFKPNNPITRQDVAVILCRYLNLEVKQTKTYSDINQASSYAIDAINAITAAGYMQGSGGKFYPTKYITRAETAVVFCNLLGIKCNLWTPPPQPQPEPEPVKTKTYIGTYKLTYYCAGCNSPRGSRATASGRTATEGVTIAVPSSMYSKYKGKTLYIENVGYRRVDDVCGTSAIDVFCSGGCSSQPLSCSRQKVYLVTKK